MEKRLVNAFIHITRVRNEVTEDMCVQLNAEVTKEAGRLDWLGINYSKHVELTAAEYRDAEDAIFDAAKHHWETFAKL